ncbi:putative T7SS-secreted protein [Kitasatospora sp. NPDC093679]|uniref:putative T7SS-secreted protein n=1 Tax=Kitasatospora sp. NPDC093679 TaxID=3154983 RepID=UPI0034407028
MAGIISGLREGFGEVVGAHAHAAGAVLDFVGLDGAAKAVDDWGDDVAADLGAAVGEKNLGESEDPKDLVHGDTEAIAQSAAHLRKFAAAFESTASGLSRMDSEHWQGRAADAFRAKFGQQPVAWRVTADACEAAAGALESLAGTIQWAQGQARQAIEEYRRAQQASKDAADAYDRQVADYNHSVDAYNRAAAAGQSPTAPTQPGAFRDPGADGRRHAAELLLAARKQRVSAADQAERAIRAATTAAPKEPGFLDRTAMALADAPAEAAVGLLHFEGGLVKGAVDVVKFGRGLNPMDPYNLTHPAVYLDHVNSTVAGLVRTGNHPMDLVTGLVGSGWGKDPAEAGGKLVFNIVSGIATGGGSEAGVVAERAAIAAAEKAAAKSAAQNAAVHTGESAAEQAAAQAAKNTAAQQSGHLAEDAAVGAAKPNPASAGPLPDSWKLKPVEPQPAPVHEPPAATATHSPTGGAHDPAPAGGPHPADTGTGGTPTHEPPAHEPAAPPSHEPAGHEPAGHEPGGQDPAAHNPGADDPAGHDPSPGHEPASHEPGGGAGAGQASGGFTGSPLDAFNTHVPDPVFAPSPVDERMLAAHDAMAGDARTFATNDEAMAYGKEHWKDYAENLPQSQKDAIYAYTKDWPFEGNFQDVNRYLRDGANGDPAMDARVAELDTALTGSSMPEDVVIARGTGMRHFKVTSPQDLVGRTFDEESYMSTSLGDAAMSDKNCILHLKVPKGTPGMYVGDVSNFASLEREVLLARGARWRADKVIEGPDGKVHVYGEVL